MNSMRNGDELFISSLELLKKTGISRATLNNYIKRKLLPHPLVKKPANMKAYSAKRLGYFPVSVLDRLDRIKQFKSKGLSMERIENLLTLKIDRPLGQKPIALAVSSFSVLTATLHEAMKLYDELPYGEYDRLIEEIWTLLNDILTEYSGYRGCSLVGTTIIYFPQNPHSNYLMNAICCALEIQRKMRSLSDHWKKNIGWQKDLFLNIGLEAGGESIMRSTKLPLEDLYMTGQTTYHAIRLSSFSRSGSIWTTKEFLSQLDEQDREKVVYGIREGLKPRGAFIDSIFSRIDGYIQSMNSQNETFHDIAALTVTEIQSLR